MNFFDLDTGGDPALSRLLSEYEKADAVSMENASIFKRIIASLSVSATLVTLFFLLYDEASQYWMILLCGLLLAAMFLINKVAGKLQCHSRYLEYRLYAESLRVQSYLHAAGSDKGVWELMPWAMKTNVPWIEQKIREIWSPDKITEKKDVFKAWVEGQKHYHETSYKKTEAEAKRNDIIIKCALIISVCFYLTGLVFEITAGGLFTGIPMMGAEGVERGRTVLKIILGTVSAASLFAGDYYGKLSLDETVEDHKRMIALFEHFEERVKTEDDMEQILEDLAREELSENSSWYAYQMKNRPDISL